MDGAALSTQKQDRGSEALLQGPLAPRALPRAGLFGLHPLPRLPGLAVLLGLILPGAFTAPALTLPPVLALTLWATPLVAESGSGRSGEEEDDDDDRDEDDDRDDDKDDDRDDSDGGGHDDDGDDDSGGGSDGGGHDGGSGRDGSGGGGSGSGGDDDDDNSGAGRSGSGRSGGGGSAGAGAAAGTSRNGPPEALFAEDILRVTFKGGTSESLRGGIYEKRGPNGEVVERRRARATDRNRLESLRAAGAPELDSVSVVSRSQRALQFTDRRGWRETLIGTRYTLTDPQGRVVTRRTARAKDYARLSSLLGL